MWIGYARAKSTFTLFAIKGNGSSFFQQGEMYTVARTTEDIIIFDKIGRAYFLSQDEFFKKFMFEVE